MFTKTLVAAIVLATASIAFVGNASAAVPSQGPFQSEQNSLDRATNGGAGHHVGDTNGGA